MILTGETVKYSNHDLSHSHLVHHKSHTDWSGIEPASGITKCGLNHT
jgi:hypothetical protein